jgi:hypothetical protein
MSFFKFNFSKKEESPVNKKAVEAKILDEINKDIFANDNPTENYKSYQLHGIDANQSPFDKAKALYEERINNPEYVQKKIEEIKKEKADLYKPTDIEYQKKVKKNER